MGKKKTSGNDIIDRIATVDKILSKELDPELTPKDPDEFLDWWWAQAESCQRCPLSETRNHVVKPDGTSAAVIMIIGEGPGFLEDLSKAPLVGPLELRSSHCNKCSKIENCYSQRLKNTPRGRGLPPKAVTCEPNYTKTQLKDRFYIRSTGAIIDGILLKWKFNYARQNWIDYYNSTHDQKLEHVSPWFVTNVTLCRSTDVTKLKDASPEGVARDKCKRWLIMQWAAVNPKLIVCFGRIALASILGSEAKAATIQPNTFIDTKFGKVLFNLHPAYYMRERNATIKAYGFAKIASTIEKALEYVGLPT